jgi:hypothetical protein
VVSRNSDEMKKHAGSFDFILDAVSAEQHLTRFSWRSAAILAFLPGAPSFALPPALALFISSRPC